ncbi:NAD(P)/FAD-dependent oxidoreductase [Streptomyces sp. N2-109]|uniref:NAD(P)/FAD-dependent oxidoreductase n=1 Tax=Streptomyces gossypii TaxID=2883101 RepID=A0ABT2JZ77_9ACTN|nr:FAD/NAD(P)-binding oxidoreductase [Streptomyces gossypii]MCT2593146.1 NAD(P)/FAD-dependent oxidoreductase [Streptomyces gossypii]
MTGPRMTGPLTSGPLTSATGPGIIVVGASLAGVRAARALRERGYGGRLTLVGDERHPPYDRPPLSKEFLTGPADAERFGLPLDGLEADWVLGRAAERLDPRRLVVALDDGTEMPCEGLVIATGSRARPWVADAPRRGVHTLRGLDDARALGAALAGGGPLLIAGAGFVGTEIAAAARAADVPVTLVDKAARPWIGRFGAEAAAFVERLHRDAGVDLRCGTRVEALTGDGDGDDRVTGAELSDGTSVAAGTVVVALGAVPSTGWLAGSGLALDQGVRVDAYCRALRTDGTHVPGIVAAGDVARWPHPWVPGRGLTLGHWSNAVEQAEVAARTLLFPQEPTAYRPVPSFWSDQYGVKFRSVGLPELADTVEVREQSTERRRLDLAYYRDGALVGALTANRAARTASYQAQLAAALALAPDGPLPGRQAATS